MRLRLSSYMQELLVHAASRVMCCGIAAIDRTIELARDREPLDLGYEGCFMNASVTDADKPDPDCNVEFHRPLEERRGNIVLFREHPTQRQLSPQQLTAETVDPGLVQRRRPRRWGRWLAIATASVLVCTLPPLSSYRDSTEPTSYSTAVGERIWIKLPDGSIVNLDANSYLEVGRFSDSMREVRLVAGRSLFQVSHHGTSPFYVRTPQASVEDLHTKFTVDSRNGATAVSVLEGAVQVSPSSLNTSNPETQPIKLAAGGMVRVLRSGETLLTHAPLEELERKVAWTDGFLVFSGETLAEAAEEMNRHNVQQILVDADIANLTVGGTFYATDPNNFLELITQNLPVQMGRFDQSNDRVQIIRLVPKEGVGNRHENHHPTGLPMPSVSRTHFH